MNQKWKKFVIEAEVFVQSIVQEAIDHNLQSVTMWPDHLCFRVASLKEYDEYRSLLLTQSQLLTETLVNGRPIASFKLNDGFHWGKYGHRINVIELPAPKLGSPYKTGFEHVEFVTRESFTEIEARFPNLKFVETGNLTTNPELVCRLTSGSLKFHYQSLERVIEIEQAHVTDVIFDLDGTLIHSREQIFEINRQVFSEVLEREVSIAEARQKFAPEFSRLLNAFEVTQQSKKTLALELWSERANQFHFELFSGAAEILDFLVSQSVRIHLWTARDECSTKRILQAHKIENLFTSISCSSSVDAKPQTDNLRFSWRDLPQNSVLMIGDSATDMIAAKNIEAIAAAAKWCPYASNRALIESKAELFFDSLRDLENWWRLTQSKAINS